MTSRHQTETSLQSASTPHGQQPVSANAEAAYDRLTGYGFARRYVKGKIVADIDLEGLGYGSRLLAETAESVTDLTRSSENSNQSSPDYAAPNLSYRTVELPGLPFSESSLDVVVAFGVIEELEHPEDLVKEAKHVLKQDGLLLISAMDKQANTIERNRREDADGWREMYVPELRELLERHFGQIRIYRQAAVAGGLVFPVSEEVSGAPVETARFSLTDPRLGVGPLTTRSVIAVCSDAAEVLGEEEQPYLLLDRDRRVFDECEERAEDIELLRGEIRQIQETEVQAFIEAIKVRQTLVRELLRSPYSYRKLIFEELRYRRSIIQGNIYAIRQKGAVGSAKGAYKRLSGLYRRLIQRQRP